MKDLDDVLPEAVQELHFVPVERMDDVPSVALHAHIVVPVVDERVLAKPAERLWQMKT